MGRKSTASLEDWTAYYQEADRLRTVVGDPLERFLHRKVVRERLLMIASGLCMTAISAAFLAMLVP